MASKGSHAGISAQVTALIDVAHANPWWQFTADEIAAMMGLSLNTVSMIKKADASPFAGGASRPERVAEWLASHPGWKPSEER